MKRSILAACLIGLAAVFSLGGCGTGSANDPTAASPALSHFNADLVVGYEAVEAARVGATNALQAHAITVAQSKAVQTQCKAFTASLDSLRAAGASGTSQTTLTATLAAINAAVVFTTISQGVPKS